VLEKVSSGDSILPVTNDQFLKSTIEKLGFFPTLPKNVRLICHHVADSCLLYNLYLKTLDSAEIKTSIHIHFDKYKAQASLYYNGTINDKVKAPSYKADESLIEKVDEFATFATNTTVYFGQFELSVSSSDIDEK
jgi:hypothetical protein